MADNKPFQLIRPRGASITKPSRAKLVGSLSGFGTEMQRVFQTYPTKPARSTYTRTGSLGRHWTKSGPRFEAAALVVKVGSNLKTAKGYNYAQIVLGFKTHAPRQGKVWKRIGWPNIEIESKRRWKRKYLPIIIRTLQGA